MGSLLLSVSCETKEVAPGNKIVGSNKSHEVFLVADWVVRSRDSKGLPFMIVDKKHVSLFVFDVEGRILAVTPILCGLAIGDLTTPGVGSMRLSEIPPKDRTTPAGRFFIRRGYDLQGGEVLWLDYESAFAIHVIPEGKSLARSLKGLESARPSEHRQTLGCINVTKEFYATILSRLFSRANGYAYVLPETMPVTMFFGISR